MEEGLQCVRKRFCDEVAQLKIFFLNISWQNKHNQSCISHMHTIKISVPWYVCPYGWKGVTTCLQYNTPSSIRTPSSHQLIFLAVTTGCRSGYV